MSQVTLNIGGWRLPDTTMLPPSWRLGSVRRWIGVDGMSSHPAAIGPGRVGALDTTLNGRGKAVTALSRDQFLHLDVADQAGGKIVALGHVVRKVGANGNLDDWGR